MDREGLEVTLRQMREHPDPNVRCYASRIEDMTEEGVPPVPGAVPLEGWWTGPLAHAFPRVLPSGFSEWYVLVGASILRARGIEIADFPPKPVRYGPGGISEDRTRHIARWQDRDIFMILDTDSRKTARGEAGLIAREVCRECVEWWDAEDA